MKRHEEHTIVCLACRHLNLQELFEVNLFAPPLSLHIVEINPYSVTDTNTNSECRDIHHLWSQSRVSIPDGKHFNTLNGVKKWMTFDLYLAAISPMCVGISEGP